MDTVEKLGILADAAKYDVACTSSGSDRQARPGQLGNAFASGICHSFTADGRCISLLKVLFTNVCIHDCAYCVNRSSNDIVRASFKPRELADLVIAFYRRNYIEGLFLSSGVAGSADATTERIIECLQVLRSEYGFRGYIHAKAIPGTSPDLIEELGSLCDRLSVNLELPSQRSLELLAPGKTRDSVLSPMHQIRDGIAADRDTRGLMRSKTHYLRQVLAPTKERSFAPAGQSTQMIIGATPESDYHILNLSSALYRSFGLKRVFFSAYVPVNSDERLPADGIVQLDREHRLYQADWLMRFYGFSVDEIIGREHPFLDTQIDPKANWALTHLEFFPVEINKAPKRDLLRVPGIGVKGANLIVRARRQHALDEDSLRKLGIALNRARYFVTCSGRYLGLGCDLDPRWLRAQLAAPIHGGRHGRRATRVPEGQLSLFDDMLDSTPAESSRPSKRASAKPELSDAAPAIPVPANTDAATLWSGAA